MLHSSLQKVEIITGEDLVLLFPDFRNIGCKAAPLNRFWRVFIPSLILHVRVCLYTCAFLRQTHLAIETDGVLHPDGCARSKEQASVKELTHLEAPSARVSHGFVPTAFVLNHL